MQPFRIFQPSGISTDCDRCGGRVDLLKGGVCTRCRRILCYRHLHGSWWRRLVADLRNESVCVDCRAGHGASIHGSVDANAG
jgi:hypothetical protein